MTIKCPRRKHYISGPYSVKPTELVDQRGSTNRTGVLRCGPPKIGPDRWSRSLTMEADNDTVALGKKMIRLRPDDAEGIVAYLKERLELLQQQALKRIAKAWIKGICPKKQARFPYKSQQQKDDRNAEPVIPEWWPIEECPYREPDHVDKQARTHLCLHILRLRPTMQQLEDWNNNLHNSSHKAMQADRWADFLKTQTLPGMFDALGKSPEPEEKVKQRQKVLSQMYYVAAAEEAYLKGERDGSDIIYIDSEDEAVSLLSRRSQVKKRTRDVPKVKASDTGNRQQKKTKHTASREAQRKKAGPIMKVGKVELKKEEVDGGSTPRSYEMEIDLAGLSRSSKAPCKTIKPQPMRIVQMHPNGFPPSAHPFFVQDAFPIDHGYHSASSSENSPLTASFSSQSSQDNAVERFRPYTLSTNFPGHQHFKYEEPTHHQVPIQVRHVTNMPHAYIEAAPNTPMASPAKFAHFPHGGGWPGEYAVAQPMERYPVRASTPIMPTYAMPVPVYQPSMVPSHPQHVSTPFIEQVDRRSTTPASDVHSTYGGYPVMEYGENAHHGLPVTHHHHRQIYRTPDENAPPTVFPYLEQAPDPNFPADPLPGSVVRGNTGYASGVGEVWT